MSQKIVELPDVGEVILSKRRGAKNLRLTIQPGGKVKVGMPAWAPYSAGINFALGRKEWILENLKEHTAKTLADGHRIGKSYRLSISFEPAAKQTSARVGANVIRVRSHLAPSSADVQTKAAKACERALRIEAANLLNSRVKELSGRHGFEYKDLRIKRLVSRWGSCSQDGLITLNYFLVQLPWHLIDYVILHELVHTKHLNHSPEFWSEFERIFPRAKVLRKEINGYRPVLLPG